MAATITEALGGRDAVRPTTPPSLALGEEERTGARSRSTARSREDLPLRELIGPIWELRRTLTVYDAAYIALARSGG